MQDSHRQLSIFLITVFTLLQITTLWLFGYTPYPDSEGYILLAKECVSQGSLYPLASHLNDYPFLWNIGAINAVVMSLSLFHSITPLLVVYGLMKGMTAWMFYQLTETIANKKTALAALLLYIAYPANYGEATSTLSELPFMFFAMLALWLIITKRCYVLGGMTLAVANWFRPMGVIFLLAILVYLFVDKRKSVRPLAGYATMILVIGSLSYLRTGLFLYQAKTGWMALADYSTQHAAASMDIRENSEWNVSQKDDAWRSLFFKWLTEHPAEYMAQMPGKLVNTFVSDNVNMCTFIPRKADKEYMYEEVSMSMLIHSFPRYSPVQWLTLLNLCYYYLLLLTALAGIRYFRIRSYILPCSIILTGILILVLAGHGEARFHIPFMPFIMILSAFFIIKMKGFLRI